MVCIQLRSQPLAEKVYNSDLQDAYSHDSLKRKNLAYKIRDACVNVSIKQTVAVLPFTIYDRSDFSTVRTATKCVDEYSDDTSWMTVTSHGIPENVIQKALDGATMYFALPEEIKKEVSVQVINTERRDINWTF